MNIDDNGYINVFCVGTDSSRPFGLSIPEQGHDESVPTVNRQVAVIRRGHVHGVLGAIYCTRPRRHINLPEIVKNIGNELPLDAVNVVPTGTH